jgi:uncharacterized membrane protein YgdD (TMEM256/DUF423 family)
MNKSIPCLALAGAYGLAAVVLGAFGAHALEERLQALETETVWETAVNYQMWHALAVLIIVALRFEGRLARAATGCFCVGIPFFSGSLYWLALDGPRWLGPITPLGGLLFVIGWILFVLAVVRQKER